MVVNERDLLRTKGRKAKDFKLERLQKYHDAGTWTFTGSHYVSKARDVVVHGVLMAGKCYTHELIPVDHNTQIDAAIDALKIEDPQLHSSTHDLTTSSSTNQLFAP